MSKLSKSMSFSNAVLDLSDMSLTEIKKDDIKVFDIMEILKMWDKIEGISLTIRYDSEFSSEDGESPDC